VSEETTIDANEGWQIRLAARLRLWRAVELISTIDVNEGDTIWLAYVLENNPGVGAEIHSPSRLPREYGGQECILRRSGLLRRSGYEGYSCEGWIHSP